MSLIYTPEISAVNDAARPQTFDDFLNTLAQLRLAPTQVTLDIDKRTLTIRGERAHLSAKEFDLLAHLATNAERTVSREELFATVWAGSGLDAASRTVDAHVRRLRKKLNAAPELVATIHGQGYRFNANVNVHVRQTRVHTLAA